MTAEKRSGRGTHARRKLGRITRRKSRQAPDPDSLLVDQRRGSRPDAYNDRWGGYGPPIEHPPPMY